MKLNLQLHTTRLRLGQSRRRAVAVQATAKGSNTSRRVALTLVTGGALVTHVPPAAEAVTEEIKRRRRKIPLEEYKDGPQGIKYYDLIDGTGAEAVIGSRVAVHYSLFFRNITIATSRQGAGVTGGTPVGFNVGTEFGTPGAAGLPGIDLGVRGMRIGGLRKLHLPPDLAFGDKGAAEIPPNSYVDVDVELLAIKSSPFGSPVKLVEG